MPQPSYVIGHQQPDTDTICSALAYARLRQVPGRGCRPGAGG
jgi:manganese-dependent inorganic pyrophosphatase